MSTTAVFIILRTLTFAMANYVWRPSIKFTKASRMMPSVESKLLTHRWRIFFLYVQLRVLPQGISINAVMFLTSQVRSHDSSCSKFSWLVAVGALR